LPAQVNIELKQKTPWTRGVSKGFMSNMDKATLFLPENLFFHWKYLNFGERRSVPMPAVDVP
jgi:hypothetical protein